MLVWPDCHNVCPRPTHRDPVTRGLQAVLWGGGGPALAQTPALGPPPLPTGHGQERSLVWTHSHLASSCSHHPLPRAFLPSDGEGPRHHREGVGGRGGEGLHMGRMSPDFFVCVYMYMCVMCVLCVYCVCVCYVCGVCVVCVCCVLVCAVYVCCVCCVVTFLETSC